MKLPKASSSLEAAAVWRRIELLRELGMHAMKIAKLDEKTANARRAYEHAVVRGKSPDERPSKRWDMFREQLRAAYAESVAFADANGLKRLAVPEQLGVFDE